MQEDILRMYDEDGNVQEFSIIEETKFNGCSYILVALDSDEDCYILKDVSNENDPEAVYEFIEDEAEEDAVISIFEKILEENDIGIENE